MDSESEPRQTASGIYAEGVTVSASQVAAELRDRLPGLPTKKLHKLLYFCQGHHLAAFGAGLFTESVMAWDMGPVVGSLWKAEQDAQQQSPSSTPPLGEAELNTIGYVVSTYGRLTGRDLEILSHHQGPWRRADEHREPGASVRIEPAWLRDWFGSQREYEIDDGVRSTVRQWLGDAGEDRAQPPPGTSDHRATLRGHLYA